MHIPRPSSHNVAIRIGIGILKLFPHFQFNRSCFYTQDAARQSLPLILIGADHCFPSVLSLEQTEERGRHVREALCHVFLVLDLTLKRNRLE